MGFWPGPNGFSGLLQGDWGWSFEYNRPVGELIGDRLVMTAIINFFTILFIYVVAFPIGVYSATRQYSWGDYGFTLLGYIGLATPNFLLALVLLVLRALTWRALWRQMRFERLYATAARKHKPADARALARLAFQALERVLPARGCGDAPDRRQL